MTFGFVWRKPPPFQMKTVPNFRQNFGSICSIWLSLIFQSWPQTQIQDSFCFVFFQNFAEINVFGSQSTLPSAVFCYVQILFQFCRFKVSIHFHTRNENHKPLLTDTCLSGKCQYRAKLLNFAVHWLKFSTDML